MRRGFALLFVVGIVAACRKAPPPTQLPPKCEKDAECIYVRSTRGICCANPCPGYGTVVHVEEAAAIAKYNGTLCTKERMAECPQVGACGPTPPRGAPQCRAGACVEASPVN